MSEKVPAVSIIITPEMQKSAGVLGPVFDEVLGTTIDELGVHVVVKDHVHTDQTVRYFYPTHSVARVKFRIEEEQE
jgi:hypothetical protein